MLVMRSHFHGRHVFRRDHSCRLKAGKRRVFNRLIGPFFSFTRYRAGMLRGKSLLFTPLDPPRTRATSWFTSRCLSQAHQKHLAPRDTHIQHGTYEAHLLRLCEFKRLVMMCVLRFLTMSPWIFRREPVFFCVHLRINASARGVQR